MYVTLWPTLGPPLKTCWSHQLTTNRIMAFDISLSELWHNNLKCLMLNVAKCSCALHAHTTQFQCPNNVIEVVHLKLHKNACAMKYSHTGFGGLTTDPILLPFPFLDFYISIHLCMYCVCVCYSSNVGQMRWSLRRSWILFLTSMTKLGSKRIKCCGRGLSEGTQRSGHFIR